MGKQNISDLINQAKTSHSKKSIQKVTPVKAKSKDEVQFSFYMEKELLKQLKLKALEEEKSIKSIINEALKNHLKTK